MAEKTVLPLLALRDIVVFPHMVVPLFVGRKKSVAALDTAMPRDRKIFLAAQRVAKVQDPEPADIHTVGTIGTIIQLLRLPDSTVKVLVEGHQRAVILSYTEAKDHFEVEVELVEDDDSEVLEAEALTRAVKAAFEAYAKLSKKIPPEIVMSLSALEEPGRLADTVVTHLPLKMPDRQAMLELFSPLERLERLLQLVQAETEILLVEKKIKGRVRRSMEKSQRDYYLNEQMQAIQKELGEKDEFRSELNDLVEKAKEKKLPEEALDRFDRELNKLRMMSPMSAEATVVRNYLDWILALPWLEYKQEQVDVSEAERILDEDHYGLEKPKERILEYLAVHTLTESLKGPILCLVGPPGTGKTSLARSVARATSRDYIRLSLGGVRDEAEIRGHRRTYIGALPGRIIQSLRKVGSSNPVFLLDEVDKMTVDFRGDPSAALLEVLDPEQNSTFSDHYMDLDYDLSKVMFITTANYREGIPLPLQDRMEIIELSGYTETDKLEIAKGFLVPKQIEANGIGGTAVIFADKAIQAVIRYYTRESGVRNLEREIASICRKIARDFIANGKSADAKYQVTANAVKKYLGRQRFKHGKVDEADAIGVCQGLAVTAVGGDLMGVEASVVPAADRQAGRLAITGLVQKVMEESGHAALTYIRSRARALGISTEMFQNVDIHVHIPEGAIPKDGPSAGITMATAMVSALAKLPVRADVAMTGEITLRGRVLPIGGLKQKLIAAHRGGIKKVIIPADNEKDLPDVPAAVRRGLEIVPVEHMDDVLLHALAVNPGKLFQSENTPENGMRLEEEDLTDRAPV
ncbi:MAG: endopeptidase La [Pseudomonadota bacterium]